jgi:glutamate decarboxylase
MLHKRTSDQNIQAAIGQSESLVFGSSGLRRPAPKFTIPESEMQPRQAYQIVHDELMLDGNSRLNLATFVTTWIEPEARELMAETFDKNMIDKDEYPQTAEIEMRCVNILSNLFHGRSDQGAQACGCSTIGSSEAAMLGGMAMKWNWRKKREAQGKDTSKPNFVVPADVQVCWEKFCVYWDIEMREVPMRKENGYRVDMREIPSYCDENTIGVLGILGTTYTGEFQDIKLLDSLMEEYNAKTGYDIPVHVDAASGGFVAPFLDPDLEWDFRLKWVKSINVSGHKFGLVAPGVGWALWKNWEDLPEKLIFHVNYLGGDMPTFALNFSRPGSQVIAQYYNLIRLGYDGYRKIHQACMDVVFALRDLVAESEIGEVVFEDIKMPLLAFKLKDDAVPYTVYDISKKLRNFGWQVPAYTLAEDCNEVSILRVVAKEGFTYDLATLLVQHIREVVAELEGETKTVEIPEASQAKIC